MSRLGNNKFKYKLYSNILSMEECNYIIEQCTNFKESQTTRDKEDYNSHFRKSSTAVFSSELKQITKLRSKLAKITNTTLEQQETPVSVIKYSQNEYFLPHMDAFGRMEKFPDPHAGDRLISGILYLNDNYTGGETYFKSENIKIKGNQGDLLIWHNLNDDGSPNRNTIHSGQPVTYGTKYIVVIWVREKLINKQYIKTLL